MAKYLTNKNLLEEYYQSKLMGTCTDGLAEMFLLLATRIANKPNWRGYSWRDDMIAEAVCHCISVWYKFDPKKQERPNPFAYFTQVINHIYVRMVNQENRHRDIKDEHLMAMGLDPSYAKQHEND